MRKDSKWLNFNLEVNSDQLSFSKFNRVLVLGKYAGSFCRSQINGLYSISKFVTYISVAELYQSQGHKKFQDVIISICVKYKVNILIIDLPWGGYQFDDKTFEIIKNHNIKIFGLAFDNASDQKFYIEKYSKFDGVLSTSPLTRLEFDIVGIPSTLIWPLPRMEIKDEIKNKNIDVSFVGGIKADRKEWLKKIEDNGIKIEVYGYGTKNGYVPYEEYIDIMRKSKITINFNRPNIFRFLSIFDKNINWRTCPTLRNVEAALSGTLLLTEWVPEIELMFENNTIDYFNSEDELIKKIKFYLKNNKIREDRTKKTKEFAKKNLVNKYKISESVIKLCSDEAINFLERGRYHRVNNGHTHFYKVGRLYFFTKKFIYNILNFKLNESFLNLKFVIKDLLSLNIFALIYITQLIFKKNNK